MKRQILHGTIVVALWSFSAAWIAGCLTTDEPEYQSTFNLNAGDLSLSEFDLSMEGLERSTDLSSGGAFDPTHDYCEDYCECRAEIFYDYYGYWLEMDECLQALDDYGYGNEDCYTGWLSSCTSASRADDYSGYSYK